MHSSLGDNLEFPRRLNHTCSEAISSHGRHEKQKMFLNELHSYPIKMSNFHTKPVSSPKRVCLSCLCTWHQDNGTEARHQFPSTTQRHEWQRLKTLMKSKRRRPKGMKERWVSNSVQFRLIWLSHHRTKNQSRQNFAWSNFYFFVIPHKSVGCMFESAQLKGTGSPQIFPVGRGSPHSKKGGSAFHTTRRESHISTRSAECSNQPRLTGCRSILDHASRTASNCHRWRCITSTTAAWNTCQWFFNVR